MLLLLGACAQEQPNVVCPQVEVKCPSCPAPHPALTRAIGKTEQQTLDDTLAKAQQRVREVQPK